MLKTCIISLSFIACVISVTINRELKAINEGSFAEYPRCYLKSEVECMKVFNGVEDYTRQFNSGLFYALSSNFFSNKSEIIIRHKDLDILERVPASPVFYERTLPQVVPGVHKLRASISSVRAMDSNSILVKGFFAVSTGKSANERVFGKFANVVGKDGKISQHLIKVSGTGILFK